MLIISTSFVAENINMGKGIVLVPTVSTLMGNKGTVLWPGFAVRLGRSSELRRIMLRAV
jgi:hypothetical protein